jgi:hypothetical protein
LQLGEGLEAILAALHGSQVLAADSRQVNDRYSVRGNQYLFQFASDRAAQPYSWASALLWAVVAENDKLRHLLLQARDYRLPLADVVRPEGAGGSDLDIGIVPICRSEGLHERIYDLCHLL